MTDQITVRTKEDASTLKWLQAGTSSDKARPVLNGMYRENGRTITADGFILLNAPTPEAMLDVDDKSITVVNNGKAIATTKDRIYSAIPEDGQYPDYKQFVPSNRPSMTFAINPHNMIRALNMPTESAMVIVEFHGPNLPLVLRSGDYSALVMPMAPRDDDRYDGIIEDMKQANRDLIAYQARV